MENKINKNNKNNNNNNNIIIKHTHCKIGILRRSTQKICENCNKCVPYYDIDKCINCGFKKFYYTSSKE